MNICERKGHQFYDVHDEDIVKQHQDYHETTVKKTYVMTICHRCGKTITREEIVGKKHD